MPRITDITLRAGTAAAWTTANPVLDLGEPGYETDTRRIKIGDGSSTWTALPYAITPPVGFGAPSGGWQVPSNVLAVTGTAVVSGAVSFLPFDVGPGARSFNALGVQVTTAQVGGTTTTTLAVYPDDGSGGRPNTAAGSIVSTTVVLTATGTASGTIAWNASPGRYWLAFLYVASVAPTTTASINFISTGGGIYSTIAGNPSRSIIVTSGGQTVLPTTGVSLSPSGNQPVVSAKAA